MSSSRVALVSTLAGVAAGGVSLFLETGYFQCDTWLEPCTVQWAVFWVVIVAPWLAAVYVLARSRAVTVESSIVLTALYLFCMAVSFVLSALLNLDRDLASDDIPEAWLFSVLLFFGTPVVFGFTFAVGAILQRLIRSQARQQPTTSLPPRPDL
jgi:cation transport ATPase